MACKRFLTLRNGIKMPIIGYGTWRVSGQNSIFFFFWSFEWNSKLHRRRHPFFSYFCQTDHCDEDISFLRQKCVSVLFLVFYQLILHLGSRCWNRSRLGAGAWSWLSVSAVYWFLLRMKYSMIWLTHFICVNAVILTPPRCIRMSRLLDVCLKDGSIAERWNAKTFSSPPNCRSPVWNFHFSLLFHRIRSLE